MNHSSNLDLMPLVESTVADIVSSNLNRARVFERFGIDYCCGGNIPLSEACAKAGVERGEVLAELAVSDAGAEQSPDFFAMGLADLADHIEHTHHAYLRQELPRLADLFEHVSGHHAEKQPELLQALAVFHELTQELMDHIVDEETRLFPACRTGVAEAALATAIAAELHQEHKATGQALVELRSLLHGYQPAEDACRKQRALLHGLSQLEQNIHLHVHKEENILLPRWLARVQM